MRAVSVTACMAAARLGKPNDWGNDASPYLFSKHYVQSGQQQVPVSVAHRPFLADVL